MDTETNSVVTVGFTTKVDHQTTSKISHYKSLCLFAGKRNLTTMPPITHPLITTERVVPKKTLPAVEWRLRKRWSKCYPSKTNTTTCGPNSGFQKRRRVCYFVGSDEKAKWSMCTGPRFLTRPCQLKKCPSECCCEI